MNSKRFLAHLGYARKPTELAGPSKRLGLTLRINLYGNVKKLGCGWCVLAGSCLGHAVRPRAALVSKTSCPYSAGIVSPGSHTSDAGDGQNGVARSSLQTALAPSATDSRRLHNFDLLKPSPLTLYPAPGRRYRLAHCVFKKSTGTPQDYNRRLRDNRCLRSDDWRKLSRPHTYCVNTAGIRPRHRALHKPDPQGRLSLIDSPTAVHFVAWICNEPPGRVLLNTSSYFLLQHVGPPEILSKRCVHSVVTVGNP